MIVLPTMHKRIRRSFLRLVLLFGALGVLMVIGITIAGRVPSELIRMNYDSIAYAQEMVRAMNGIRFPGLYRDTDFGPLSHVAIEAIEKNNGKEPVNG